MSRFFIPAESISGDEICLRGKEVHHIVNVMRLRPGDEIVTFDGTGAEYTGTIKDISPNKVLIKIEEIASRVSEKSLGVTLAQAIPRKAKMDYIVQKCTELGVRQIIPLDTVRTVVRLKDSRIISRCKRWERIANQASKQCGRTQLTKISKLTGFKEALEDVSSYDLALIPCLAENVKNLKDVLINYKKDKSLRPANIIIFIGPEGGFTPEEISIARDKGATPVSLGRNVLKTDTAAIATLAIINYELS